MANDLTPNPIYIDDVSSNVAIATGHTGISDGTVFLRKVLVYNPTNADKIVLKNASGDVVAQVNCPTLAQDETLDFVVPFRCQGLQLLAADNTLTTGNVLIYLA